MQKEYFDSFNNLNVSEKRDVLIKDISDTLNVIETLCVKNNIKINKLKSAYYIKNQKLLFDEDYYKLMFICITYLKEDLALLLKKSA